MKDPHDKQTIDGFADLVTQFEKEHDLAPGSVDVPRGVSFGELTLLLDHVKSGLKRPVGRPPKGDRAMTKAEKQKAYRDRQRAAKQQEQARLEAIGRGEAVTSDLIDLTSSFSDVYKQTRGKPGTQ